MVGPGAAAVDDDIHLLRQAVLRPGVLSAWRMLAAPCSRMLTGSMVAQVGGCASLCTSITFEVEGRLGPFVHARVCACRWTDEVSAPQRPRAPPLSPHYAACFPPPQAAATYPELSLRVLDVSGSLALSDTSLAQLLALCPHLTILRAAGTNFGPACLSVLCGRAAPQAAEPAASQPRSPEQQPHLGQRQSSAASGSSNSAAACDAFCNSRAHTQRVQVQQAQRAERRPAFAPAERQQQPEQQQQAGPPLRPLFPSLYTLDASHCPALSSGEGGGTLLPRALCHCTSLVDLRLNGAAGAGLIFEAAARLGAARGSGSAAAALLGVLGQLTRLELLDAGGCWAAASLGAAGKRSSRKALPASSGSGSGAGLSWQHVDAMLRLCTSLRHLALSSQQLAAQLAEAGRLGQYGTLPEGGPGSSASGSHQGAAPGGQERCGHPQDGMQQGGEQQAEEGPPASRPSLLRLAVGWGTGGGLLCHLLRSSPYLASLTVHAGADLGDWHLRLLAAGCRHLAALELRGANVTEQGGPARWCWVWAEAGCRGALAAQPALPGQAVACWRSAEMRAGWQRWWLTGMPAAGLYLNLPRFCWLAVRLCP